MFCGVELLTCNIPDLQRFYFEVGHSGNKCKFINKKLSNKGYLNATKRKQIIFAKYNTRRRPLQDVLSGRPDKSPLVLL